MIKIQKAPKSDNKLKKSAKPGKKVEKKGMNYTQIPRVMKPNSPISKYL